MNEKALTQPHPYVTVVVPVLNEAPHLAACLDALLHQDYPPDRLEILLVDGGSTDGSREMATSYARQHPHIRVLENPEGIAATALNRGIAAARGEVIVRVDGHTLLARDYIRQGVHLLQSTGADAVGGPLRPVGRNEVGQAIATAMAHPLGGGPARFRHAREPEWVDTVYLGVWRRETLRALGGFHPCLAANEDFELYHRLRQAGGRVLCHPHLRSWTLVRDTWRALWDQYTRYGFWKAQMLRQHPRSLKWRQVPAPLFVLLLGLSVLLGLWDRRGWWFAGGLLGLYAGITGLTAWRLVRRGKNGRGFRVWLAFWVMHLAWGIGFWRGIMHRQPPCPGEKRF